MKRKNLFLVLAGLVLAIVCIYGVFYSNSTAEATSLNTSSWVNINMSSIAIGAKEINKEIKDNYVKKEIKDVKIPILMYHVVSKVPGPNNLTITTDQLRAEVKWLKEEGYTLMTMTEVLEAFKTGIVPKKPIALTFDDGEKNNYTEAFPILKEEGVKATFFLITSGIGNGYYMDLEMAKEMKEYGMDMQSHTSGHLELNKISKEKKIYEIKTAQEFLKNNLGVDNKILCYPVGRNDKETHEVAKSLGIELAVTTQGGVGSVEQGMLTMPRRRISPMPLEAFKKLVTAP